MTGKQPVRKRSKMGPSGDPAATRAALVAAAQRAFEEAGFEGTDTNRIARAAGYSPQTFYRHFPDKLAIFVAAYERWVETQLDSTFASTTLATASDTVLRAHAATRTFRRDLRRLSVTDPRVRAVRARERQRQLERLRERFPAARELPLAALAAWLLCAERLADAIVDDELVDLGVTQAAAKAQLRQMLDTLQAAEQPGTRTPGSTATGRRTPGARPVARRRKA